MLKKLIVLTILILLFAISANVQSQVTIPSPGELSKPIQEQANNKQQPAENDQRGTEKSPLIVKTITPRKTQAEADQDRKDREEKAANDRHLVWYTGLLVLFTAVLAIVSIWQGWFSWKALTATQRAYIAVKQIKSIKLTNQDRSQVIAWRFNVVFENSGDTPAINMSVQIFKKTSKSDIHEIPMVHEYKFTPGPKTKLMARSFTVIGPLHVSLEDIIDVFKMKKHLYIFGKVFYNDIFSKRLHTEMFCEEIGIIDNPIDPITEGTITFTSHPVPDNRINS